MTTNKLDQDAQAFWDKLQQERAANPPKRQEIVVEVKTETRTEPVPTPETDEIIQ